MDDVEEDVRILSSQLDALTSYIKGMEVNLEIKSEQLKEEAITHGGETTTLESKLENARQSQEDNRARIQALENATPKPKEDLINSILIRLARLEDNQSELIRGFNPPAYPPRTYDKVQVWEACLEPTRGRSIRTTQMPPRGQPQSIMMNIILASQRTTWRKPMAPMKP